MNFFESQEAARQKTRHLVGLFILAVGTIILAIWLAVGLIVFAAESKLATELGWDPWTLETLAWVAALTLIVVVTGSVYKILSLRAGGPAVARVLGARPINPNTRDLRERRLLNVVEEMSIASGMAVPSVYLLDGEEGINAFAAGFSPTDTVVAVTRGTLDYLSRDELQGVIGHELSHALNGDTRIKLRLMGLLHGILVIAVMGRILLRAMSSGSSRSSGNSKKGGGALIAFGIALLVIGYVGVLFGRLIKAAVSRQRELLADAAAVQFTRNPSGIAGALKKIGGLAGGSKIQSARAEEASHLFFGQAMKEEHVDSQTPLGVGRQGTALKPEPSGFFARLGSMMATHPPLAMRIVRLEPQWDGQLPSLDSEQTRAGIEASLEAEPPAGVAGPGDFVRSMAAVMATATAAPLAPPPPAGVTALPPAPAAPPPPEPTTVAVEPAAVVRSVGKLDPAHIGYAERLLAGLPPRLREGVHEPMTAGAVVFALLLDREPLLRERQLEELSRSVALTLYAETVRVSGMVDGSPVETRLPLVDLALPALRRMSEPQYRTFRAAVERLVAADQRLSLFEFTLQRILLRHLEAHFRRQPPPPAVHATISAVGGAAGVLLSALAHAGQPRPEAVAAAFEAGRRALGANGSVALCAPSQCGLDAIGRALSNLARSTPAIKQKLLEACVTTVAQDKRITVREGELLRAMADSLDCPLPPLLPGQTL